mgnify:CR=1 FL=1
MSQISLKSISGITSITTPAGVDNQLTLHTNDTTEKLKLTSDGVNVTGVVTATSFSGSGASLTNLNGSNIASGTVPVARIGTGTKSTSTFYRGDGTFATVTAPAITAINSASNNRVVTSDGGTTVTGEANLTFDGDSLLLLSSTDGRRVSFAGGGTSHYMKFDNTLNGIILNGYGGIAFETNGTNERVRIDGSGNFMIGSTSAEAKLDVTGGVSISSNGVTVSPSGYDLKIRSNTGKLGVHIDNSSGTPTLEFGTGNATTGGAITTNNHGIFLKPGNVDKLKVEPDGVRSFATFVDTSYHANPDPLGDGSGIAYYRLNYNFQDSGRFGNHGQGIQGGDPTFALVNSSGEPCWNNPTDGAINIPNLKNSYPFSMAAWINVSSWPTTGDNDLIMNLSIGGQRVSLCICCWGSVPQDGADFYIMYGGTGHHYFRPSSRPTNTWIHVVYSVVSSNNTSHRVYQNGSDLTTRGDRGGGHGGSAGWAMGGNNMQDMKLFLRRMINLRDDKLLEKGERDLIHVLGTGLLEWSVMLTAVKRKLRETVNSDLEICFDCASPFLATAYGQIYTQHVHQNDRFSYIMDKALDDKRLADSTIPLPWTSPVAERLNMGNICWYKPGMLNKLGKEGKTSWDSFSYFLMMAHNVYQHIESVQRSNALTDAEVASSDVDLYDWQKKLKSKSKIGEVNKWVPRNLVYFYELVDKVFASEKPMDVINNNSALLEELSKNKRHTSTNTMHGAFFEAEAVDNADSTMEFDEQEAMDKLSEVV